MSKHFLQIFHIKSLTGRAACELRLLMSVSGLQCLKEWQRWIDWSYCSFLFNWETWKETIESAEMLSLHYQQYRLIKRGATGKWRDLGNIWVEKYRKAFYLCLTRGIEPAAFKSSPLCPRSAAGSEKLIQALQDAVIITWIKIQTQAYSYCLVKKAL